MSSYLRDTTLGIDNFTFHNLRHTFASMQSDTGADIVTTKELLGHSDITMTMRYSHKQLDVKRNAIERITGHILGMSKDRVSPLVAQTVRRDFDMPKPCLLHTFGA